jgi:adenylate cyclase
MDFRKPRLPVAILGMAVFAAAFAVWVTDTQGLRTGTRHFGIDVALPWLLERAASWTTIPSDILDMFRADRLPVRPPWADMAEMGGAALLSGLAILLAIFGRRLAAIALTLVLCIAWIAATVGFLISRHAQIDIAGPPALAFLVFVPTALAARIANARRNRRIRQYFGHHLSPPAVEEILERPSALKLSGEYRDVTVLFADIDGFTELSEHANPGELMQLLDGYFEVLVEQVHAHGGMIDRRMGDGVYAIFNAPIDLADHPRRAIACARALVAALETYRQTSLAAKMGLGRTRIGIETGPVIVGDVGAGRTFDYAVHGDVMVAVARLEVANKALGTVICVGPGTATRLEPKELVHKGSLAVRGRSPSLQVYTPAPAHA